MRWRDYQLSRLEMVFAVIVLLIILSAILNRAVVYFTMAERALVDNVVTNMNAALRLETAHIIASGQLDRLGQLENSNPISLIEARPPGYTAELTHKVEHEALLNTAKGRPLSGYIGEINNPEPSEYKRGSWYFNKKDNTLVYLVRNRELFRTSLEGVDRIRFRIELDYRDRNGNGQYEPATDEYLGVRMVAVNEYEWLL